MRLSLKETIDRLGRIKAQMADLETEHEKLRQRIIAAGIEEAEGKLFRATVSHSQVPTIDYKGLLEKLAPPKRIVTRFTSIREQVRVNVVARTG